MRTVRRQTRSFALASAVLLALAVAASWYLYRYLAMQQLKNLSERSNAAMTQVLFNDVADEIRNLLAASATMPDEELRASAIVASITRKVALLASGTTLIKVSIFDLTDRIAYSTDADMIGRRKTGNAGFGAARAGEVFSTTAWKDKINTLEGEISDRHVVESYVPIHGHHVMAYRAASPIIGVVKVLDDVSDALDHIERNGLRFLLITTAIMMVVYAGLIVIVWRSEVKVTTAVARAEAASQAKSDFLAQMGHELRTPLNAIIGFSEIIGNESMGPVGQPKYKAYAGYIFDSGKHLLKIVNDILDMVKAEPGMLTADLHVFDARDTLIKIEKLLDQRARARCRGRSGARSPAWSHRHRRGPLAPNRSEYPAQRDQVFPGRRPGDYARAQDARGHRHRGRRCRHRHRARGSAEGHGAVRAGRFLACSHP